MLFTDRFIELNLRFLYCIFGSFLNSGRPSINKIVAFCGIKQHDDDDDDDNNNDNGVPVTPLRISI